MADDDAPEVLDLGTIDDGASSPGPPPRRHSVSRRAVLGLGGLAALGGGVAVVRSRPSGAATVARPPGPAPTPGTAPSRTESGRPAAGQVVVTRLRRRPLDGEALDVFGLSDTAVVRVELATGRVTRTSLPPLSDVTLWFAAVRGGVLVHRDDGGTTYFVPDPGGLREAAPALAGGGPLLPGPDLDHVWMMGGSPSLPTLDLVGVDGRRTKTSVRLPALGQQSAVPDGGGFPLVYGVGGAYWARPQGLVRVTTGAVLAVGPTGWLVVDCDERDRCSGVLVERSTTRRPVPGIVAAHLAPSFTAGAISPDGRTAALYVGDPVRDMPLILLDLRTGNGRGTDLTLVGGAVTQSLAWSPNGRWVFAVDASAQMIAVDARSGRTTVVVPDTIVPAQPVVQQIAIRPGP